MNNNKNALKDAYCAAELAALKIEGYPGTERGMNKRADAGQWPYREVPGRGGPRGVRREFLRAGLPTELRTALFLHEINAAAPRAALPVAIAPAAPAPAALPVVTLRQDALAGWQIEIARARAAVLEQVDKLGDIAGPRNAKQQFMRLFRAQEFDGVMMDIFLQANARPGESGRTLSKGAIYHWQQRAAGKRTPHDVLVALAPGTRGKRYAPLADEALTLALYRRPNKPALAWCVREVLKQCPGTTENALTKRVKRLMEKVPAPVFYPGRHSGAAFKSLQVFRRREFHSLLPNQIWVGDGHSMKFRVAHPETGKPFVPELTIVMDVQSRFVAGWSISFSENVLAVADALRHGISRYGAPLIYYSDNGSGQTAKMLDAEITGLLPGMGIEHHTGIAGNPQGRGVIERWWQTVAIPFCKRYDTYRGHGADRDTLRRVSIEIDQQIRAIQKAEGAVIALPAKLPLFHRFVAELTVAIDDYNNHHHHKSLPKLDGVSHATPAEYRAARVKDIEGGISVPSMELTTLDFMPSVLRTAARGEVKLWNGIYFDKDLMLADREQVRVHFDIHDASRVWVKRLSGELIAVAAINGNRSGFFEKPYIDKLADERTKRQVKLLDRKIADVLEERGAGPLVRRIADTAPMSIEDAAALEAEVRQINTRGRVVTVDDPERNYKRWCGIARRADAGQAIDGADGDFHRAYKNSDEWRSMERMAEDFPELKSA